MCVHYTTCTHVLVYKSWDVMGVVVSRGVSRCGVKSEGVKVWGLSCGVSWCVIAIGIAMGCHGWC